MSEQHSETGWAYALIFDDLRNCGCGYFHARLELVRQVLRDCPLYDDDRWERYDDPLHEWLLCVLDGADLIEHGGSILRSWLTPKGERFLAALNDPAVWEALTTLGVSTGYCECGDCCPPSDPAQAPTL